MHPFGPSRISDFEHQCEARSLALGAAVREKSMQNLALRKCQPKLEILATEIDKAEYISPNAETARFTRGNS